MCVCVCVGGWVSVCARISIERQPWYISVPRTRRKVIKTHNIFRYRCVDLLKKI